MTNTSPEMTRNLALAETHLARFRAATVPHTIAGRQQLSEATFDNLLPTDNTVLSRVARGGAQRHPWLTEQRRRIPDADPVIAQGLGLRRFGGHPERRAGRDAEPKTGGGHT